MDTLKWLGIGAIVAGIASLGKEMRRNPESMNNLARWKVSEDAWYRDVKWELIKAPPMKLLAKTNDDWPLRPPIPDEVETISGKYLPNPSIDYEIIWIEFQTEQRQDILNPYDEEIFWTLEGQKHLLEGFVKDKGWVVGIKKKMKKGESNRNRWNQWSGSIDFHAYGRDTGNTNGCSNYGTCSPKWHWPASETYGYAVKALTGKGAHLDEPGCDHEDYDMADDDFVGRDLEQTLKIKCRECDAPGKITLRYELDGEMVDFYPDWD